MLVITHYQRLLNYIVPDKVHVLADGRIQKSGGKELALELEKSGYAEFQARRPETSARCQQVRQALAEARHDRGMHCERPRPSRR